MLRSSDDVRLVLRAVVDAPEERRALLQQRVLGRRVDVGTHRDLHDQDVADHQALPPERTGPHFDRERDEQQSIRLRNAVFNLPLHHRRCDNGQHHRILREEPGELSCRTNVFHGLPPWLKHPTSGAIVA